MIASAALDMDQLGACYELWAQWAREENDHNLDTAGWWRNAMTAVNGMIIHNTTAGAFNFREGGAWVTK